MSGYLVTIAEQFRVEAESKDEAEQIASDLAGFSRHAETRDISVEEEASISQATA